MGQVAWVASMVLDASHELSDAEKRVWQLHRALDKSDDKRCTMSAATMALRLGIGTRSVERAREQLVAGGVLYREGAKRGTVWRAHVPPDATPAGELDIERLPGFRERLDSWIRLCRKDAACRPGNPPPVTENGNGHNPPAVTDKKQGPPESLIRQLRRANPPAVTEKTPDLSANGGGLDCTALEIAVPGGSPSGCNPQSYPPTQKAASADETARSRDRRAEKNREAEQVGDFMARFAAGGR